MKKLIDLVINDYFAGALSEKPMNQHSLTAGFALLYLASQFKPAFTPDHIYLLFKTLENYRIESRQKDYWSSRLLETESALYLLTDNPRYIETQLRNIDHHNSTTRRAVFDSLYYLAPKIEFANNDVLVRTERNIEVCHFFLERNLYLLHSMKGSPESKQETFKHWLSKHEFNAPEEHYIEMLSNGFAPYNPFASSEAEAIKYLFSNSIDRQLSLQLA